MSHSPAAQLARTLVEGFDRHYRRFNELSAEARAAFERSDWDASRAAATERIFSYDARVREVTDHLGADAADETLWPDVKREFVSLLFDHLQPECAETFFNSVATRVLKRRYYTNQQLFWRPALSTEFIESTTPTWRVYYPQSGSLRSTVRAMLGDPKFASPWADSEGDVRRVERALAAQLPGADARPSLQVHLLASPFFRGKAAYLIGRVRHAGEDLPFGVALLKDAQGAIYVDAVLLGHDDLATLFSLAHAYFMVEMEVPSAYVNFLKSIFPGKPNAELYTSVGLQKQGKTLFYRDLHAHLRHSTDKFIIAPGVKGMVMVVFTLPSFSYVFKIIRDVFEPPKDADRAQVKKQYLHVKLHDRVGRMADTLEFSDAAFPIDRFDPELIAELDKKCPSLLERDGNQLVIKHLYIERRMIPLDLWLAKATEKQMLHGVREYGNAIKELAGSDLFPGDMLLKNFGVTRAGRVVFYDYDEIAEVTACRFRRLPTLRDDDDDHGFGSAEFYVDKNDVFPEELPKFIFGNEKAREMFMREHGELATPEFWLGKQAQLRQGIVDDVFPYPQERRFAR